jgi:uncharacterized membrane protein YkvA (DUF1232 family)
VNQEDLLENLQQQIRHFEPAEQDKVFRRLASYMLNLSPIGHAQALKHAQDEASNLLAKHPVGDGLTRLLRSVARLLAERPEELAEVSRAVRGLVQVVERAIAGRKVRSKGLGEAVAALAYLRNPYDHIFDLHVEGGFADDTAVIRDAWASLQESDESMEDPTPE